MNNTDLTIYTNDNNNLVNLGFIFDIARMIKSINTLSMNDQMILHAAKRKDTDKLPSLKSFNNGNILDY